MLLYDMGEGFVDNCCDFMVIGCEWKMCLFWGIGLMKIVNFVVGFLYDGCVVIFEEVILWYGGEVEKSKCEFIEFSSEKRVYLISFL